MVSIQAVRTKIAQLSRVDVPRVAVFCGGTAGIGKQTIDQLVRLGYPIRVYIVGRNSAKATMRPFLSNLQDFNPKSDLVWIDAEASRLSEVAGVCRTIKSKEKSVDLLFLSAGYAPFGGRDDTAEGLDVTHVLGYYARMLFIHSLLPLLRSSPSSCVISVLSGCNLARNFAVDDLHLEKPGAWEGLASQLHIGTMNTLTMDTYAAKDENAGIKFVHNWPGYVNTGNSQRYRKSVLSGSRRFFTAPLFWLAGQSLAESGERHLYIATGGPYGDKKERMYEGSHGGVIILDDKCDVVYDEAILEKLKKNAQAAVWQETMRVLASYL